MPGWLIALSIVALVVVGLAALVLFGLNQVVRALEEDDRLEREEWYPFADPD